MRQSDHMKAMDATWSISDSFKQSGYYAEWTSSWRHACGEEMTY